MYSVPYIYLVMGIEYYVYEILGVDQMRCEVEWLLSLFRIDKEASRVELIEVEPEHIKTMVNYRCEVFN